MVGQSGQHEPIASQSLPAAQRVPVPVHVVAPMQVAGMLVPQSTIAGVRHAAVHVQTPAMQVSPLAHGPMQWPPQPSASPHIEDAVHVGTHWQRPVSGLQTSCGFAHGPPQKPPQPSGVPQVASAGQCVMQTQRLLMQRSGGEHAGEQPQVSTHVPLLQT